MMCWNYDKTPWEEFPDMSISLLSSISNSKEFRLKIPPQVGSLIVDPSSLMEYIVVDRHSSRGPYQFSACIACLFLMVAKLLYVEVGGVSRLLQKEG